MSPDSLDSLLDPLLPALCALCASPAARGALACAACERELRGGAGVAVAVPGANGWAATRYEGAARKLVAALKFSGRLRLAELAAELIAAKAPPDLLAGSSALVPVPAVSWRRMWRGFDPAERIALALARATGLPFSPCLERSRGPRQVGRGRAARLADPPKVRAAGQVPRHAVLVDDVTTTGATLRACARALRSAGSERVVALTFAAAP